jgi:hypothetical protein
MKVRGRILEISRKETVPKSGEKCALVTSEKLRLGKSQVNIVEETKRMKTKKKPLHMVFSGWRGWLGYATCWPRSNGGQGRKQGLQISQSTHPFIHSPPIYPSACPSIPTILLFIFSFLSSLP